MLSRASVRKHRMTQGSLSLVRLLPLLSLLPLSSAVIESALPHCARPGFDAGLKSGGAIGGLGAVAYSGLMSSCPAASTVSLPGLMMAGPMAPMAAMLAAGVLGGAVIGGAAGSLISCRKAEQGASAIIEAMNNYGRQDVPVYFERGMGDYGGNSYGSTSSSYGVPDTSNTYGAPDTTANRHNNNHGNNNYANSNYDSKSRYSEYRSYDDTSSFSNSNEKFTPSSMHGDTKDKEKDVEYEEEKEETKEQEDTESMTRMMMRTMLRQRELLREMRRREERRQMRSTLNALLRRGKALDQDNQAVHDFLSQVSREQNQRKLERDEQQKQEQEEQQQEQEEQPEYKSNKSSMKSSFGFTPMLEPNLGGQLDVLAALANMKPEEQVGQMASDEATRRYDVWPIFPRPYRELYENRINKDKMEENYDYDYVEVFAPELIFGKTDSDYSDDLADFVGSPVDPFLT